MPMSRAPRKRLTGWVAHSRPTGYPNMARGRTLKKALVSAGIPTAYTEWRELAAQRDKWRELCGGQRCKQESNSCPPWALKPHGNDSWMGRCFMRCRGNGAWRGREGRDEPRPQPSTHGQDKHLSS
jgi:hypothetical protein